MNKYVLAMFISLVSAVSAFAYGDEHFNANIGILAPNCLDATLGYEMDFTDTSSLEIFAEAGNHWQTPVCCKFWKGYYWDGGALYKLRLKKFKNSNFRLRAGALCGADKGNVFCGVELGFEYNHIFKNQWQLSLIQKNNVNFVHGDLFRNGLMIGLKIPF